MSFFDRALNVFLAALLVTTLCLITLHADKIVSGAYKLSIPVSESIK